MEHSELRATADKLLDLLDQLRRVEQKKRSVAIGSAEFVSLAEEAERLGRVLFRWSQIQLQLARREAAGPHRPGTHQVSLTEVEPRPLDLILADWREAQLRLEAAKPGSAEALQAVDDVERLREEFQVTQQERHRGK